MNVFSGHISNIKVHKSLSIVSVQIQDEVELKTIVVETPETAAYLHIGTAVKVLFKETEVIIAEKDYRPISIQNIIKGVVKKIEKGVLLSKVILTTAIGDMEAILVSEAIDELMLTEHQEVLAMVKVNEIMISG